jgi:hypothetical protein
MREADETLKERHVVRAGVRFFSFGCQENQIFYPENLNRLQLICCVAWCIRVDRRRGVTSSDLDLDLQKSIPSKRLVNPTKTDPRKDTKKTKLTSFEKFSKTKN